MKNNARTIRKKWIRPLPERLVNKIAAGEVIERPAAVLKELVENSLDAGAGRIEVIVEKSGTRMISVIDDGCGIDAEQVEIAFSRHATSKIFDFNDLENIRSFGFRGEALPSIASVSKTCLITRTAEAETGMEIIIEGGVVQSLRPVAAPPGTKVEVYNLFFNTPARRKFLKAESTEARHLTRNAVALALGTPDTRFSYTINGRKAFSLDERHRTLEAHAKALLLGTDTGALVEVVSESPILKIHAYIGPPDQTRQNQGGLYIFINKRFVKSQTMVHAVTAGYGELLPKGNYPVGAVFLEIDPSRVDVNVHPTKAEVRLSQERQVHDILYHAVKRTLRESGGIGSIPIADERELPKERLTAAEAIRRAKSYQPPGLYNQTVLKELYGKTAQTVTPSDEALANAAGRTADMFPDISTESVRIDYDPDKAEYIGRLAGLYLIFKTDDRLLLMDQHAAHERILYEENIKSIEEGGAVSQSLLFPTNIELPPERFALYEESAGMLTAAGFVVEPFGGNAVLLSAVPAALSKKSPEELFAEILEDVENLRKTGYDLTRAVAEAMACRAAIMAGDKITEEEAKTLLLRLYMTRERHYCPHGRPTILKITKKELDARFGRK